LLAGANGAMHSCNWEDRVTTGPHLLLVEDERSIRDPLARLLAKENFRVTAVEDAASARNLLPNAAFDLAIIDIMMPGEDGLSLTRFIRAQGSLPVILLTARTEDIDRIVGLEIGADDYLGKPFNPRELTARIRAVLRRTDSAAALEGPVEPSQSYRFGDFILDCQRRQLRRGDQSGKLTEGEFRLLEAMVSRPGRVLNRDQLLDLTRHRSQEPFDRAIDNMVLRLRKRIEEDPSQPELIQTVYGVGYVFTGAVERV